MSKLFKKLAVPAVAAAMVALSSNSCKEGEHDYYYRATNSTDKRVTLNFKLNGDLEVYYDTLQPGETHTLTRRGGVTGDDVWDVETASEIYQFASLEACLDSTAFTENIKLRSLWGSVQEQDGNGVYTLNLTADLFTLKDHMYWYWIYNNTDYTFHFNVGAVPIDVAPGSPFPLAFPSRGKYVKDLCDTTSTARINHFSMSSAMLYTASDTVYCNNFNPNKRLEWTFETTVDPALYGTNDTVGVYKLTLTNKIFE